MDAILSERFARCIAASKRVRWDIDTDVIRGRRFDIADKFLPDGLSLAGRLDFFSAAEKRYFSQIQGRTYANMFGLVERYIAAMVMELGEDHWFGDQVALEALLRFTDEELKHQELFRRVNVLMGEVMPAGYSFPWNPNAVAAEILGKSSWATLGLTLHIELFTQIHYRESIYPDDALSPLIKEVFRSHWLEESQHAILDELEWRRIADKTSPDASDRAVDELIELFHALDEIIQAQAANDAAYFAQSCGRRLAETEQDSVRQTMLEAYRLQYVGSGMRQPHFLTTLASLTTGAQFDRIRDAVCAAPACAARRAA
jgi:hypothetical protein